MGTFEPLYAITDATRLGEDRVVDALTRARAGGLRWVQVREKRLPGKRLAELARRLRHALGDEVRLVVNGDVDLAVRLGLAGVHLGGDIHAIARARDTLAAKQIIGFSAHDEDEIELAARLGADYVSYSPIFAPSSKPSPLPPLGLAALAAACRCAALPVYALGGIDAARAAAARRAGARGVAAIGAILDAADPETATRAILASWRASRREPEPGDDREEEREQ